MHHFAHDRAMTLNRYPDFILLHYCTSFTGLRVCASIVILLLLLLLLLYFSVRTVGPRLHPRDIVHYVTDPRARRGIIVSLCTMTPGRESGAPLLHYYHV